MNNVYIDGLNVKGCRWRPVKRISKPTSLFVLPILQISFLSVVLAAEVPGNQLFVTLMSELRLVSVMAFAFLA